MLYVYQGHKNDQKQSWSQQIIIPIVEALLLSPGKRAKRNHKSWLFPLLATPPLSANLSFPPGGHHRRRVQRLRDIEGKQVDSAVA